MDKNKAHKLKPYRKIGYQVLGPLITGFCIWLHENLKDKNYSKVLFLARDARLFYEAYHILFGDDECNIYFHISRRAAANTVIDLLKDYQELHDLFIPKDFSTLGDLCSHIGAPVKEVSDIMHIPETAYINKLGNLDRKKLYETALGRLEIDSKGQRKLLIKYLEGILSQPCLESHEPEKAINLKGEACCLEGEPQGLKKSPESIALVDVGWEGRIQWCLKRLMPGINIDGYYLAVITKCPKLSKSINMDSFWGKMKNTDRRARVIMETIALIETLFLSPEGTTLSYQKDERGKVIPVFGKPDHDRDCESKIRALQRAALKFVRDAGNKPELLREFKDPERLFKLYQEFSINPDKNTIKLFKNFMFGDGRLHSFGAKHSLSYYIFRPKKLLTDIKCAKYRVFFLRDLTKLPLPWFELLYLYYRQTHKK